MVLHFSENNIHAVNQSIEAFSRDKGNTLLLRLLFSVLSIPTSSSSSCNEMMCISEREERREERREKREERREKRGERREEREERRETRAKRREKREERRSYYYHYH